MKAGILKFFYFCVLCLGFACVLDAQIVFTAGTPPNGAINTPYPSFAFTGTDACSGDPTITWFETGLAGTGLTLDSNGSLTGAPLTSGIIHLTVKGDDSCQEQTSQNYPITIADVTETYLVLNNDSSALSVVDLYGSTTVSCPSSGPNAPCFGFFPTSDFALDTSGNYIVPVQSGPVSTQVIELNANTPTVTNPPPVVAATGNLPTTVNMYSNLDANFFSVAVDAGNNYIVADMGNTSIWFFPHSGATPSLVGTYAGATPGSNDVFVRIDSAGNYIVVTDGNLASPSIQFFQFTQCTIAGVCPAPQTPSGILTGIGNVPGPITTGPVSGFTIDSHGNYVIDILGSNGPYVASVTPGPSPTVQTLFANANFLVGEPLGIFADPLTGNYLIVDGALESLDAVGSDGTGIGQFVPNPMVDAAISVQVKTHAFVRPPPPPPRQGPPPAPIPTLILTGGALPGAFEYEPYSASVAASGGLQPYLYTGSGFPTGIGINQYGAIGGATMQAGNFTANVTVTDARNISVSAAFSLTVAAPPPLTLPGGALTSTVVGTPSSFVVTAAGGAPPYTFALAAGAFPQGLSLLPNGTLHGTPVTVGANNFTIRATDSTGGTALGSFSLTILPPPLTLTSASPLATGVVTIGYPAQTVSATGGTPPYAFAVTAGALPAGLSLSSTGSITGTPTAATPTAAGFTVTATDSSTPPSTGTVNLFIAVQPFSENIVLSSGSAAFNLASGSTALPPAQTVQVQSTSVGQTIDYTVSISPPSANWLSASSSGGATPGSFSIGLTTSALSLAASTSAYTANVVVACATGSPCQGNSQTVAVSLTVTNLPPQLNVIGNLLSFNTNSAAPQTTTQQFSIQNGGGGSIGLASISCGQPWCTLGVSPGSVAAGATAPITVTANPTGLGAGYYYTSISVVSSAGSASIPVTLQIAQNGVMSLGPAGAAFTLPQGGAAVGDTSFLVSVTGSTPIDFSLAVQPGAPWLIVNQKSVTASGTQPARVAFVLNQALVSALEPGSYYGQIQVSSSAALNSPQSFEVVLNVTPPGQATTPSLVPGGLIFLTQAAATPPVQTITVYSASPTATGYQASAATNSGGSWLTVTPTTGSTSSSAAASTAVSVNPTGMNPGVYTGTVNYAFSATAVRSVNVTLVVEAATPSAQAPAVSSLGPRPLDSNSCTPSQLVPTSTALVSNFAAPAAWPIELAITLVDDCGDIIGNGLIVATFSNGDPPLVLSLADPNAGNYVATWTPQRSSAQITIDAQATAPGLPAASAQIAGAVTPNNAPILATAAIANFYNPIGGAPLAPGALIQITGQYLAGQTLTNAQIPLPTALGGTSVIIGGLEAPVSYVSPGQVNAQVPFELTAGQPYQVLVVANNALTTPQSFQAGAASPGLSVLPSGYVQAGHQDGTAVTEAAPAAPGENISVYLVGMGATTIPVPSGQPGPAGPYATTVIAPDITLNNEITAVTFSGLIPGLVGVYQVNLQVPADAASGDLTLSLVENGFTSNSGLLPVQN